MLHTVPNSPTNGAAELVVATSTRPRSISSISSCTERPRAVATSSSGARRESAASGEALERLCTVESPRRRTWDQGSLPDGSGTSSRETLQRARTRFSRRASVHACQALRAATVQEDTERIPRIASTKRPTLSRCDRKCSNPKDVSIGGLLGSFEGKTGGDDPPRIHTLAAALGRMELPGPHGLERRAVQTGMPRTPVQQNRAGAPRSVHLHPQQHTALFAQEARSQGIVGSGVFQVAGFPVGSRLLVVARPRSCRCAGCNFPTDGCG